MVVSKNDAEGEILNSATASHHRLLRCIIPNYRQQKGYVKHFLCAAQKE
jgi:hypothetical protein